VNYGDEILPSYVGIIWDYDKLLQGIPIMESINPHIFFAHIMESMENIIPTYMGFTMMKQPGFNGT